MSALPTPAPFVIPPAYLSPQGRSILAAESARIRSALALRRTQRFLEDINRRIEDVPTVPLLPLPEVTEIDVEDGSAP